MAWGILSLAGESHYFPSSHKNILFLNLSFFCEKRAFRGKRESYFQRRIIPQRFESRDSRHLGPKKVGQMLVSGCNLQKCLEHQNRRIAIASDFRVDGARSPEIPQKEGVLGSDIAAPKSQITSDFPSHPQIAMQHCFLLSRKSLRFLGSAMGTASANRKNHCDFGALCKSGRKWVFLKGARLL